MPLRSRIVRLAAPDAADLSATARAAIDETDERENEALWERLTARPRR